LDFAELKALGIVLKSSSTIERAYEKLKGIPLLPIAGDKMLVLDLDSLPTKPIPFKEVFLRWAIAANEGRLLNREDPIFPYELVKRCPLWRTISMPIKTFKMTKEGLFNKPKLGPSKQQPGTINRK
jgi:hypothetical protein